MDEKPKYYGTVTELQEIRKALKYLATTYDNLSNEIKSKDIQSISERLVLKFEHITQAVIREALTDIINQPEVNSYKAELYKELNVLKKQWRYARTQEERERIRGLINSIMFDINNY